MSFSSYSARFPSACPFCALFLSACPFLHAFPFCLSSSALSLVPCQQTRRGRSPWRRPWCPSQSPPCRPGQTASFTAKKSNAPVSQRRVRRKGRQSQPKAAKGRQRRQRQTKAAKSSQRQAKAGKGRQRQAEAGKGRQRKLKEAKARPRKVKEGFWEHFEGCCSVTRPRSHGATDHGLMA